MATIRNGAPASATASASKGEGTREKAAKATVADSELVDAKAAAAMLGVKAQTLYAYVSRGLLRTTPRGKGRGSLYYRDDLEAIRMKGRRASPPLSIGSPGFLRWGGGTALHTSITALGPDGPSYRGHLATQLAQSQRNFEDCVELLWSGLLPQRPTVWKPVAVPAPFRAFMATVSKIAPQNSSRRLMALATEAYTACTGRDAETALGAPVLAARQLVQILAPVLGMLGPSPTYAASAKEESIALTVARCCSVEPTPEALDALNACLILCADHELPPSTFAARIAASAGADIFSCVSCALGAFEGILTGMGCDESERALLEARSQRSYVDELKDQKQRHAPISGYGHPLYPAGDPRAQLLLAHAVRLAGHQGGKARAVLDAIRAAQEELGLVPNLAIGLVAVTAALSMPTHAPGALMALGRTAGWVAHSFEQRMAGFLVRPRARYIGPPTQRD